MKIEHIIDDIKKDVLELSGKLEEQLKYKMPALQFSLSTPGLDELSTIKTMALIIEEGASIHCLSVAIHTHNGNRVFENPARDISNGEPVIMEGRHPMQDSFVELLRDVIKRRKNRMKQPRQNNFYNNFGQYARTG